jgi:hypothetical protein
MASRYPLFDRTQLTLQSLSKRTHDLDLSIIKPLTKVEEIHPNLAEVATRLCLAKEKRAATILMMGAHVLRSGTQKYLIDLIEKGLISCIAVNGACAIHDFELALIGATTENVDRYITTGQFGLWRETGIMNDVVLEASENNCGFGEHLGYHIDSGDFPHKEISLFAAAYRAGIPVTVHTGIGYDITHEHPGCDGAAYGKASYTDFLIFTKVMENLSGGVVMNFGSAVMAPEIFLKSLAMVRNSSSRQQKNIDDFTTLVCDLKELPRTYRSVPMKTDPDYYFRPWKTMLVRTLSEDAMSFYVQGDHKDTIPSLWSACIEGDT